MAAAGSIYMCFTGVRGEAQTPLAISTAPASGSWMELTGCEFSGHINYGQRNVGTVMGEGDAAPIRVLKLTDASSPGLMREALFGTFDKNAVITFLRTAQGNPEEYLRLELEGCGLVEFSVDSKGHDRSVESFAIRFGRLSIVTWHFDNSGRRAPSIAVIQNEG